MKSKRPTFTVVVTFFNLEDYAERAITSVLGQSYRDFEVILVDDGSTDNTGAICARFAERDARVRVITKDNGGASSARNVAINAANGEWISFLDGDDAYSEDFLLHMSRHFTRGSNLDLVAARLQMFWLDGRTSVFGAPFSGKVNNELKAFDTGAEAWAYVMEKYSLWPPGLGAKGVYRMSLLRDRDIRFDESLPVNEDIDFSLRVILASRGIALEAHADYLCYRRSGSLSDARPESAVERLNMQLALYERWHALALSQSNKRVSLAVHREIANKLVTRYVLLQFMNGEYTPDGRAKQLLDRVDHLLDVEGIEGLPAVFGKVLRATQYGSDHLDVLKLYGSSARESLRASWAEINFALRLEERERQASGAESDLKAVVEFFNRSLLRFVLRRSERWLSLCDRYHFARP